MKRPLLTCFAMLFATNIVVHANPMVKMTTNQGEIEIELYADKAPKTVENFLGYVKKKQYTNTIFHRVIAGFVAQGGGYTADMKEKPTGAPIKNEANNKLSNLTGTLAMAREPAPHTARSQFFINLVDNTRLDFTDENSPRGWGYAVFGKVTKGMDVVEKIVAIPTGTVNGMTDVPTQTVLIKSIVQIADSKPEEPAAPTVSAQPKP